jgi:hypothetical protein
MTLCTICDQAGVCPLQGISTPGLQFRDPLLQHRHARLILRTHCFILRPQLRVLLPQRRVLRLQFGNEDQGCVKCRVMTLPASPDVGQQPQPISVAPTSEFLPRIVRCCSFRGISI